MTPRIVSVLVAGVLATFLPGCCLFGAGIGAAVPRYSDSLTPNELGSGDDVKIDVTGGETAEGVMLARDAESITIHTGERRRVIGLERIKRVEKVVGTHALTGFAVGGAIDLGLIAAAIIGAVAMAQARAFQFNY